MSLPALEHLAASEPFCGYTEVWTAGQNVPLIRFANRVRSIASTGIDAFPPRLEALDAFDDIISWYGTNRDDFREATASYPIRFLEAIPRSTGLHASDFYMRQVGGPDGAIPRIACPQSTRGFVSVHPYSGSPKKNWPHFAALATRIARPSRFCVSPEQHWPGAAVFEDLYELACWLATSVLYIGNDSGITHLAAAVGVPVIAIFQASDPGIWAPRGRAPVVVLQDPTVEEVLAAAEKLIEGITS